MFFFTYLPQLAILFFTSGPLAIASTVLLVLSESSTLTMVLSKALLIDDSLVDTFDGTLVSRGHAGLVEKDRKVGSSGVGDYIQRLGKIASKPFAKFTPSALGKYCVFPHRSTTLINHSPVLHHAAPQCDPRRWNRHLHRSTRPKDWPFPTCSVLSAERTDWPAAREIRIGSQGRVYCNGGSSCPARDDSSGWNLVCFYQHVRCCFVGSRF
jgi:hypothetical protein